VKRFLTFPVFLTCLFSVLILSTIGPKAISQSYTQLSNIAIFGGTADSFNIGLNTPALAKFTGVILNSGQTLTGVTGGSSGIVQTLSSTSGLSNGQIACWDSTAQLNSGDCLVRFVQSASVAGCTTGSAAGNHCAVTVTFGTSFPNTSYRVSCTGNTWSTGVGFIGSYHDKTVNSVQVDTVAAEGSPGGNAAFTTIDCIGVL
jgi:hypothetical protein